jgi:DNA repair protein RadC
MATDLFADALTEAELLHLFLGQRLDRGGRQEPVDRLLAEFAEYRRELEQLRASLREAEASSSRGESRSLDLEALFECADKRLEADGIPE